MEKKAGKGIPLKRRPGMTIEPISGESAAVYITPGELKAWGLTPETITAETAGELARKAFAAAGMKTEGTMEIEAYPDAMGVLLFARLRAETEKWFSFDGLEELLQGAQSLPRPRPEAALAQWEGRYWLCVREEKNGLCRLTEFGREETPSPWFEARLREQEGFVAPAGAFEVLERHFGV